MQLLGNISHTHKIEKVFFIFIFCQFIFVGREDIRFICVDKSKNSNVNRLKNSVECQKHITDSRWFFKAMKIFTKFCLSVQSVLEAISYRIFLVHTSTLIEIGNSSDLLFVKITLIIIKTFTKVTLRCDSISIVDLKVIDLLKKFLKKIRDHLEFDALDLFPTWKEPKRSSRYWFKHWAITFPNFFVLLKNVEKGKSY